MLTGHLKSLNPYFAWIRYMRDVKGVAKAVFSECLNPYFAWIRYMSMNKHFTNSKQSSLNPYFAWIRYMSYGR